MGGVLLLRRALSSVLVLQPQRDGWAIAVIVLLLAGIGVLAALIPARRAASVDPMQALRTE
jgi:ABC-type lipoprotein release transport system permease subunit